MASIRIPEVGDPRLAHYRELPRTNQTRDPAIFIVEGRLLVERLVASEFSVESILVDAGRRQLLPADVPDDVPVYVTPPGELSRVLGYEFHRGVLACGRRQPIPRLPAAPPRQRNTFTLVVCAEVQDPTNLGGILRNAAAFRADAVLLDARSADPFSRRVLRVSMGAVLKLRLYESTDLQVDLNRLQHDWNAELVATVLDSAAEPLETATRGPRLALLLGNEGHGLPQEYVAQCQRRVTVPMCQDVDSLNAAVASGVFLYHFTRVASAS